MTNFGHSIVLKLAKIPNGTDVTMARKKLVFGQTIWLEDSNHLLGDVS